MKKHLKNGKKKIISLIFVIFLTLVLLISGCTSNNDANGGNTFTITAKELNDHAKFVNTNSTLSILYDQYENGDTLIIKDTISNVTYDQTFDATGITFTWQSGMRSFAFQGDITNKYKDGDKVKITVHLKHVTFSYNGTNYDMEVFAEEWVSQSYFIENFNIYPFNFLPASCIEKA